MARRIPAKLILAGALLAVACVSDHSTLPTEPSHPDPATNDTAIEMLHKVADWSLGAGYD